MRDQSLDIIKGLACLLMIFAHVGTIGRGIDTSFTRLFWYLGWFAPILFFGSVGISLAYQLRKRNLKNIIIFYLILFIVSFASVGQSGGNFFDFGSVNLIASIALTSIIVLILRNRNGLLLFILFLILDRVINRFHLPPSILHGLLFSIVPWAGLAMLGKYLHEQKKSLKWILIFGFIISSYYLLIKQQSLTSQMLGTLFAAMGTVAYSLSLLLAPSLLKSAGLSTILTYLGRNTLLFYWLHLLILNVLTIKLFAPLAWAFFLMITLICMILLKKMNNYTFVKISSQKWFWVLLLISIFIPKAFNFPTQSIFYFFNFLLIVFAMNYSQIPRLLENKT